MRFYDDLNDFLPKDLRGKAIEMGFIDRQSVKDMIESAGVPHSEVSLVLINSRPAGFERIAAPGDYISVYPYFTHFDISTISPVYIPIPEQPQFIADVNLGRLAGYLRLLGFDTLYANDLEDAEIAETSAHSGRIVLSRDVGLLKRSLVRIGYWLRSQDPAEQLEEVVIKFRLIDKLREFTICSTCNSPIEPVTKSEIKHLLEDGTRKYFNEFFRCIGCGKIYWQGSHFERMKDLIDKIRYNIRTGSE
jgi:uncharacterized protein with PIN domain